jgi:hypothetical protein
MTGASKWYSGLRVNMFEDKVMHTAICQNANHIEKCEENK